MRLRQVGRCSQRGAICVRRFVKTLQILEQDSEIEEQRRVASAPRETLAINRFGFAELLPFVEQPAGVGIRTQVGRIGRNRPSIELQAATGLVASTSMAWLNMSSADRVGDGEGTSRNASRPPAAST